MQSKKKKTSKVSKAEPDYLYDVAFSFLTEDEPLAQRLNDAIKDEVETFIYTEHQEKLSGKDAVKVFPEVFKTQARVVVILYQDGWGDTRMTGVEMTAIRARIYDEQFKFLYVVKTQPDAKIPDWINPPHIIYHDLDRFGEDPLHPIIIQKVRENYGTPRQISAADRVVKKAKLQNKRKEREQFLKSEAGVYAASNELETLISEMTILAEVVSDETKLKIIREQVQRIYNWIFHKDDYFLTAFIDNWVINDATFFHLIIETWYGPPEGFARFNKPQRLSRDAFKFDRDLSDRCGWCPHHGEEFYTSKQLAEHCLNLLMEAKGGSMDFE